jgi:hypothetical protein
METWYYASLRTGTIEEVLVLKETEHRVKVSRGSTSYFSDKTVVCNGCPTEWYRKDVAEAKGILLAALEREIFDLKQTMVKREAALEEVKAVQTNKSTTLPKLLLDYFLKNPDQEMSHEDISHRFGVSTATARSAVRRLTAVGKLEAKHVVRLPAALRPGVAPVTLTDDEIDTVFGNTLNVNRSVVGYDRKTARAVIAALRAKEAKK